MTGSTIYLPEGMNIEDRATRFRAAVPTDLLYLNTFSASEYIARNRVLTENPTVVPAQVGSPVFSAAPWLTCSLNNNVNTSVEVTDAMDFTYMAVGRSNSDVNGMLGGTYTSTSGGGAWGYWNDSVGGAGTARFDYGVTMDDGGSNAADVLPGPTLQQDGTPYLIFMRYRNSELKKLLDVPTITYSNTKVQGFPMLGAPNRWRVGSAVSGLAATLDVGLAAFWDRCLTDEEVVLMTAQARSIMSYYGVTV